MKFVVPNYSCLHNPWLRGYRPQIPVLSVLNWICWTPPKKKSWVRHCLEVMVALCGTLHPSSIPTRKSWAGLNQLIVLGGIEYSAVSVLPVHWSGRLVGRCTLTWQWKWGGWHVSLDAFAKLQKATVSFVMSTRPFVRTHGTTRLPLDRFSWSLIFEDFFSKICPKMKFY